MRWYGQANEAVICILTALSLVVLLVPLLIIITIALTQPVSSTAVYSPLITTTTTTSNENSMRWYRHGQKEGNVGGLLFQLTLTCFFPCLLALPVHTNPLSHTYQPTYLHSDISNTLFNQTCHISSLPYTFHSSNKKTRYGSGRGG